MDTLDLERIILSKNWNFYVSRHFNWFVQSTQIIANSSSILNKYLGFDISQENYLILNGDEYYTDQENKKYNEVLGKLQKKDPNFFNKLAKKEFEIVRIITSYIRSIRYKKISIFSNEELAQEIIDFQKIYTLSFVPAFSRPDDYLELKTKELIKKNFKLSDKKTDDLFSTIATYPNLGKLAYTDEPLNLLKIAKLIKKSNINLKKLPLRIDKILDKHIKLYSWMKGPTLIDDVCFSKQDYLDRINNLISKDINLEINRIIKVRKENQYRYKNLFKIYKFNSELKKYAEAVRKFIFLRTYTTEISDKLFYIGKQLLINEASKRLNLSLNDIVLLNSNELIFMLKNKSGNTKNLIDERKRGYAIIWLNGKNYLLFGENATKLQKLVGKKFKGEQIKDIDNLKIIQGTPASLGYAKGTVKVLKNYLEVNKVNSGDVLVTSMTTPDFVMAMEKASAFITDEGGITCHAAIVAREFGVPCIVGTGNATSILKDGDLVEIDAEKGEIRILN